MEKGKDPFGSLDFSLQRVLVASEIPVLLLGESGTGKTRMAREIHERSVRRSGPFVSVNLASIHEGTLESTLYGHEKGAFTGAHQARRGKFVEAHGGTLFLDEIGDIPLHVQVRLLEFLQEKRVLPLGATSHRSADVRVIAATHQDLSRQVEEGGFRGDLYWRLGVARIQLPPLRNEPSEHKESQFVGFLDSIRKRDPGSVSWACPTQHIQPEVRDFVGGYDWPGNFREMESVARYVAVASEASTFVTLDHFPPLYRSLSRSLGPNDPIQDNGSQFKRRQLRRERSELERVLRMNHCRIRATARSLGIDPSTVRRKIRKLGIQTAALVG